MAYSDAWLDAYCKREVERFNAKNSSELNDEGAISLAEAVLTEIRTEMKHIIAAYHISPKSTDVQNSIQKMDELLGSSYFNILTMGHGAVVHKQFRNTCNYYPEVTQNE